MVSVPILRCLLLAVLLPLVAPALGQESSPPKLSVAYTRFTLPNGLTVVLHEDRQLPVAALHVWYKVGSANEQPGRTGFAHLFEHLMFEGSGHVAEGQYDLLLEAAGASNNATTGNDVTDYYVEMPSNSLDLALFLESDRMGYLLDVVSPAMVDGQRDVVKNERRQSYENAPYGAAELRLSELLYPANHPYHWPVIGYMPDLTAATADDVRGFFRRYYTPANAVLAIAGDFDSAQLRTRIEHWFADVQGGPAPPPIAAPAVELTSVIREQLTDQVQLPRLYLAWLTPRAFAPGDAELDVVANLLAGGKSSRLYRRLVYELQIAQDVSVSQQSAQLGSQFLITVTAKPSADGPAAALTRIQALIDEELARLRETPPTESELQRVRSGIEAAFYGQIERVGGQARLLASYTAQTGNPDYFDEDLARYRALQPDDICAAVRRWLPSERRLELSVLPAVQAQTPPDRSQPPALGPVVSLALPPVARFTLSNGLPVVIVALHKVPMVDITLLIKSGAAADPAGQEGLASLTADLLDDGAAGRSALDIADAVALLGGSLHAGSDWDAITVKLHLPSAHLGEGLALLADVALRPDFAATGFERLRAQHLTGLQQLRDNPEALAQLALARAIYGATHRYGRPAGGTPVSLQSLTPADAKAFHSAHFLPSNAQLIVVGDVSPELLLPRLEQQFGAWPNNAASAVKLPQPATSPQALPVAKRQLILIDKPGAAQSQIRIGLLGAARNAPDYYALETMNTVLGGSFTSRLNQNLRETHGYAYGAGSAFSLRRSPGPFAAAAAVQSDKTREAVSEMLRELEAIRAPLPAAELQRASHYMALGYPGTFGTLAGVAAELAAQSLYDLPDSSLADYVPGVLSVTPAQATAAARRYLKPDQLNIVVVGDLARIAAPLRAAGFAPAQLVTPDQLLSTP